MAKKKSVVVDKSAIYAQEIRNLNQCITMQKITIERLQDEIDELRRSMYQAGGAD